MTSSSNQSQPHHSDLSLHENTSSNQCDLASFNTDLISSQDPQAKAAGTQPDAVLAYLEQLQRQEDVRTIPPLEQWHPERCGDMDLVIKANGSWWHEGRPINRQSMIDLFARVLWKEEGQYYLKTPVEKIRIQVEDAPLLVNQIEQVMIDGQSYLKCITQNQDIVMVDEAHPIVMRAFKQHDVVEYRPYISVRYGLDALIERTAFYHLIDYGQLQQNGQHVELALHSGAYHFKLTMPV